MVLMTIVNVSQDRENAVFFQYLSKCPCNLFYTDQGRKLFAKYNLTLLRLGWKKSCYKVLNIIMIF